MKRKVKESRVVFQYILVLVVFFFLVHRSFVRTPGRFERCLSMFAYPFVTFSYSVTQPVVAMCAFWKSKTTALRELVQLRIENESLYSQLVELESSEIFLDETRELRNFNQRYDEHEMHLSKVILKQFADEHFFLIDVGSNKNIKKNMAVVYKKCLVGKVTQVYPFYSKVTLITDPVCKVAVQCAKTKTEGIYQGTKDIHTGTLLHVDHLAKLKIGERVLSSGQGIVFPAGFGIGEIQEFKDTGVHYEVKVKPLLDLSKIAYCSILMRQ